MLSMMEEFAIHAVFGILMAAVKNPSKLASMRTIMLLLRDQITITFDTPTLHS